MSLDLVDHSAVMDEVVQDLSGGQQPTLKLHWAYGNFHKRPLRSETGQEKSSKRPKIDEGESLMTAQTYEKLYALTESGHYQCVRVSEDEFCYQHDDCCELCGHDDDIDLMCNGCTLSFHQKCFLDSFKEVHFPFPPLPWLCAYCLCKGKGPESREVQPGARLLALKMQQWKQQTLETNVTSDREANYTPLKKDQTLLEDASVEQSRSTSRDSEVETGNKNDDIGDVRDGEETHNEHVTENQCNSEQLPSSLHHGAASYSPSGSPAGLLVSVEQQSAKEAQQDSGIADNQEPVVRDIHMSTSYSDHGAVVKNDSECVLQPAEDVAAGKPDRTEFGLSLLACSTGNILVALIYMWVQDKAFWSRALLVMPAFLLHGPLGYLYYRVMDSVTRRAWIKVPLAQLVLYPLLLATRTGIVAKFTLGQTLDWSSYTTEFVSQGIATSLLVLLVQWPLLTYVDKKTPLRLLLIYGVEAVALVYASV